MLQVSQVSAIILAGGQGSRLGQITAQVPKPLLVVSGKPFIEWVALHLANSGVRDFVVSVGYLANIFSEWSSGMPFDQDPFPSGVSLRLSPEQTPLGTGGAVIRALPMVQEYCMVVNGDSLVTRGIADLFRLIDGRDGVIGAVYKEEAGRYGTLEFDGDCRLMGFHEKRPGAGWVNSGIYLFRTHVLRMNAKQDPHSLERDTIPMLLSKGCSIGVLPMTGAQMIDIGTPDSLRDAEAFVGGLSWKS